MGNKMDYLIEDLLNDSEKIINELKEFEDLLSSDENDFSGEDTDPVNRTALNLGCDDIEEESDGYYEIRESEDSMYLNADFLPPVKGGKPITYDSVISCLAGSGISFGIDSKKIKNAIFKCNTEVVPIKNILIAKGKPPVNSIESHYIINESLYSRGNNIGQKSNINFKEISPLILVKRGAVLAEFIPEREGRIGYTIYGEIIDYKTKRMPALKPGKNTFEEANTVYSNCDGRFEQRHNYFYVNEVLQIRNDVDYSIGNIDFPGDVIINGNVMDGFKVHSGGTIFASNTLDASDIDCKGDLIVNKGIIGRRPGRVNVGGQIKAKFIENCRVAAMDNILLNSGVMNSTIYTSGRMELGVHGVIIGGTIYAQNGIKAFQLGSQIGAKTEIHCGTDFRTANQLRWAKNKNEELANKLKQVEIQIIRSRITVGELILIRDKLKDSINRLNSFASSLVFKLDKNDNAEVVVLGRLFPGVSIEICNVSYTVNQNMSASKFRLDKDKGAITVTSL